MIKRILERLICVLVVRALSWLVNKMNFINDEGFFFFNSFSISVKGVFELFNAVDLGITRGGMSSKQSLEKKFSLMKVK